MQCLKCIEFSQSLIVTAHKVQQIIKNVSLSKKSCDYNILNLATVGSETIIVQ